VGATGGGVCSPARMARVETGELCRRDCGLISFFAIACCFYVPGRSVVVVSAGFQFGNGSHVPPRIMCHLLKVVFCFFLARFPGFPTTLRIVVSLLPL